MRLALVVDMASGTRELELVEGTLTIGRVVGASLHIDHASVSREHAEIIVSPLGAVVRDLGSTNGTFVDGTRLGVAPAPLRDGGVVRFGDIVARVRTARPSGEQRLVSANAFEERLAAETARCATYGLPVTVFAIEAVAHERGIDVVIGGLLRPFDVAVVRSRTRIDVLSPECDHDRAMILARRIVGDLLAKGIRARIGLATFPGDVPSASSLCVAAQATLEGVTLGGFSAARWGVRHVLISEREIVLADPAMLRLYELIERVAQTDAPVLVRGETGAGKELVAASIHALSARAARPLVRINCAAIPSGLVESELFGHARGAFSGADRDKVGLFEQANGGTLFLDEIGELELAVQAKLLRALEDGRIRRVGATAELPIDVRIVAATHRDLKADSTKGRFREDLYYRLSALVLQVPPLRERPREIAVLAERFVAELSGELDRRPPRITPAALAVLSGHAWPGNVRELRNVIHRAVVACDRDELRAEHIDLQPPTTSAAQPIAPPSQAPDARELERRRIVDALERCDGNQTRAAQLLGMPRRTLVYKLRALNIPRSKRDD